MPSQSILLTSDGTYPCYPGGVSVWCDQLVRQLSDVNFHVLAIAYSPGHTPRYNLPANVTSCRILPLWGTDEPGGFASLPHLSYERRLETTDEVINGQLLKPFETLLRSLAPEAPPGALALSFAQLHELFRIYEYSLVMRSPCFWEAFLHYAQQIVPDFRLTLDDCTWCMRWLQRYLAVLCVGYPLADVTHSSMSGVAGIPCVIQKLLHGTPFLLTEHGIFLRELYMSIARMKYSPACKRFLLNFNKAVVLMNYHFADAVTSLCDFNRRWQARFGVDMSKIIVIPNGVDPKRFHPGPLRRNRAPVVLAMSRIFPLKGIEYLLKASRLVLDRAPDTRFRILGDVADAEYFHHCLELVASLHLSSAVEFGKTDDNTAAYRNADVFCLPSISEGMPYSVIEAMFSGCPVVASDVGGVAETISDTGLLVRPGDEVRLAEALLALVHGEGAAARRQSLASAALARANARFAQQDCMGRFQEIYRELSSTQISSQVSAAGLGEGSVVVATA